MVGVELITKYDIMTDRLLDEDTVPLVSGASVKQCGAINRVSIQVDAVRIVRHTVIGYRVNTFRHMGPYTAPSVGIDVAAVDEYRVVTTTFGINAVACPRCDIHVLNQRDAAGIGVDRVEGLSPAIELAALDR